MTHVAQFITQWTVKFYLKFFFMISDRLIVSKVTTKVDFF
jgi:hypothetical protein